MAKSWIVLATLALWACGAAPHADTSPPTPPTGQLAAWKDFPAAADPRPIIWFRMEDRGQGFADGDAKVAATCGRYTIGAGVGIPTRPKTVFVTWKSGTKTPYGALSANEALVGLTRINGEQPNSQCQSVKPLVITGVSLGVANMTTDRGTAVVSAYLFTATGAQREISYPALEASAYWGRGVTLNRGGGGVQSARISADGMELTVAFIGAATSGDCGADYVASAAESSSAVAVAIKTIPLTTKVVACTAMGYSRTVSVTLSAPLGGRVFLDEQGNVQPVCPETAGDC